MLPFVIILLIPTGILASDYTYNGNYQANTGVTEGSSVPIDYNDPINPNSNIIFNFEQRRKDQPPQVEMRKENLGRYMYRPKTTQKPIIVSEDIVNTGYQKTETKQDHISQLSNLLPHISDRYKYSQWNPNLVQSTIMPPPPPLLVPKWADVSHDVKEPVFSNFGQDLAKEVQKPSGHDYFHRQQQLPQDLTPSKHSIHLPTIVAQPQQAANTDNKSMKTPNTYAPTRTSFPSRQHPTMNRGNHKFNWNDVITERTQVYSEPQQMTTTVSTINQKRGPPPPVPTLSPWIDGYGK